MHVQRLSMLSTSQHSSEQSDYFDMSFPPARSRTIPWSPVSLRRCRTNEHRSLATKTIAVKITSHWYYDWMRWISRIRRSSDCCEHFTINILFSKTQSTPALYTLQLESRIGVMRTFTKMCTKFYNFFILLNFNFLQGSKEAVKIFNRPLFKAIWVRYKFLIF